MNISFIFRCVSDFAPRRWAATSKEQPRPAAKAVEHPTRLPAINCAERGVLLGSGRGLAAADGRGCSAGCNDGGLDAATKGGGASAGGGGADAPDLWGYQLPPARHSRVEGGSRPRPRGRRQKGQGGEH